MELSNIAVFIKVVQHGSFTKAAQNLGIPTTTVSAKVIALEKKLGVSLIQRTTRKLSVTEQGEVYFRRCALALEEIAAAETEVTETQMKTSGKLRITAAVDLGHGLLPSLVQIFLKKYPETNVELIVTNRVVDLVGEGIDLAFRAGELEDSTHIAKKFVSAQLELYATPKYLKKNGLPNHPSDLKIHELILFSPLEEKHSEISNGKTKLKIKYNSRIESDDTGTIKTMTLLDQGVGIFPSFLAKEEIKNGKLINVLPGWHFGSGHISIVFPSHKFVPLKVKKFIETAIDYSKQF